MAGQAVGYSAVGALTLCSEGPEASEVSIKMAELLLEQQ